MNRLPALFPLIVAALLALASYWLQYVVSNEGADKANGGRGAPDAIVTNFHIDKFDDQGRLAMRLLGQKLTHYPLDDSSDVVQPEVRFLAVSRHSVWNSKHARITEQGDNVLLTGKVHGTRDATANSAAQILDTEEMTLLTRQEIGRAPKDLQLSQGPSLIVANAGGVWNNIEGTVTLNQVTATLQHQNATGTAGNARQ